MQEEELDVSLVIERNLLSLTTDSHLVRHDCQLLREREEEFGRRGGVERLCEKG